jgi:hypothetical protein
MSSKVVDVVDHLLGPFADEHAPGGIVVVVSDGHVVQRIFGLADVASARSVEPCTRFHVMSVGKTLTAYAVHRLAADGHLSLSDPIVEHLPETQCDHRVQVRHLLSMTSGLPDVLEVFRLAGTWCAGPTTVADRGPPCSERAVLRDFPCVMHATWRARTWVSYVDALAFLVAVSSAACGGRTEVNVPKRVTPNLPRGTYTSLFNLHVSTPSTEGTLAFRCLSQTLTRDEDGAAPCVVLEHVSEACDCTRPGRRPAPALAVASARERLAKMGACSATGVVSCDSACFCELEQLTGPSLRTCAESLDVAPAGWCYVDTVGLSSALSCPETSSAFLRFSADVPSTETRIVVSACFDENPISGLGASAQRRIGSPCVPSVEHNPKFSGFDEVYVTVESGARSCETGLCLVNHFRGRVDCPYGQTSDEATSDAPPCKLPGSNASVEVPVPPQFVDRQADSAVYCSCRCAGPGPGPFCTCPTGFVCSELLPLTGIDETEADAAGSYCVKAGTEFDFMTTPIGEACNGHQKDCEN